MIICAAQIRPEKGAVKANIRKHINCVEQAAESNANLIVFPELSITSYEPELARDLCLSPNDSQLKVFAELSAKRSIIIGLGLPTSAPNGLKISMALFKPNEVASVYSKQHIHEDEEPFFVPGDADLSIQFKNYTIKPAICYESLLDVHSKRAANDGADVYLASVAKPMGGVKKAMRHYPKIAQKHGMSVIMANAVGPCDNFISAGKSGYWNSSGDLVTQLDTHTEGLLFVNLSTGKSFKQGLSF